jgi:2-hydroxy-3-keto-5-methylthiopentenyl-1-phosphate phosphatase
MPLPLPIESRWQFVIDWDGTVTEQDTLALAMRHFVGSDVLDPLLAELDASLAAGSITLQEVMDREFAVLRATLEDVVAFIVENARVRAGFAEFVKRFDPLILSTSFHETIEPILSREGISARVVANRVDATDGWRIHWTVERPCSICGERCKRSLLPSGEIIYIGDGYSDRCAALTSTRVFARDGLARFLNAHRIAYEPFDDFHDVMARASNS